MFVEFVEIMKISRYQMRFHTDFIFAKPVRDDQFLWLKWYNIWWRVRVGRGIFEREMELGKEHINQTFYRGNEISFVETFFIVLKSIAEGLCSLHIEILSQILQSLQLVRNFYTCLHSFQRLLRCIVSRHICVISSKKKKKTESVVVAGCIFTEISPWNNKQPVFVNETQHT